MDALLVRSHDPSATEWSRGHAVVRGRDGVRADVRQHGVLALAQQELLPVLDADLDRALGRDMRKAKNGRKRSHT